MTTPVDSPSGKSVLHRVSSLSPCTRYSLEVVPVIRGKVFTARTREFTTTNGTPEVRGGNVFMRYLTQVNVESFFKKISEKNI